MSARGPLLGALLAVASLLGCSETAEEPALTLEEARALALRFEPKALDAPPRSIESVIAAAAPVRPVPESCEDRYLDQPPLAEKLGTSNQLISERAMNNLQTAGWLYSKGRIENAVAVSEAARANFPSTWTRHRGDVGFVQAQYHLTAGDLNALVARFN